MAPVEDIPAGLCLDCDYALRGLADRRCPECGRPFDPDDPATVSRGRPLNTLARPALGPAGWPTFLLATAPMVLLLWPAIRPDFYTYGAQVILPLMACFLALVVWLVRWSARGCVASLYARTPPAAGADRSWGRRTVLVLGTVWAFLLVSGPMRAAFWLSRPVMEQLVHDVGDVREPKLASNRRAGLYVMDASYIYRTPNGAIAFGFADNPENAFVYSPNGYPHGLWNQAGNGHLFGPWYWSMQD